MIEKSNALWEGKNHVIQNGWLLVSSVSTGIKAAGICLQSLKEVRNGEQKSGIIQLNMRSKRNKTGKGRGSMQTRKEKMFKHEKLKLREKECQKKRAQAAKKRLCKNLVTKEGLIQDSPEPWTSSQAGAENSPKRRPKENCCSFPSCLFTVSRKMQSCYRLL